MDEKKMPANPGMGMENISNIKRMNKVAHALLVVEKHNGDVFSSYHISVGHHNGEPMLRLESTRSGRSDLNIPLSDITGIYTATAGTLDERDRALDRAGFGKTQNV